MLPRLARLARLAVALAALLAPACAGIGVRSARAPALFADWRASALAPDRLSPRTVQTLRLYDLDHVYDRDPDAGARQLHAEAVRDPQPDTLFALAEMHYLRGQAVRKKDPDAAVRHYLHCCAYAQHYLLASCVELPTPKSQLPNPKSAEGQVGNWDLGVGSSAGGGAPPLTPRDAFDPRFRLACNLYNAGVGQCLRTAQKAGRLDPRQALRLGHAGDGAEALPVVHTGFAWKPEEFGHLYFCEDYEVVGLANLYRDYGLGVPLIGSLAPGVAEVHGYYASQLRFPVTALIRCDGGLADLDRPGAARLELYNPLTVQSAALGGHAVPLESDLTTPIAYSLNEYPADKLALTGFFRADRLRGRAGLKLLEPYQPGKIPVLLVHGLLSSPATWAPLYNDLQADPQLRERFQFWVYFYPTSDPYLATAADLRHALTKLRDDLDPRHQDATLDQMVMVGHSMGGLVSKLLTVDGGDDFWKLVSDEPIVQVKARADVEEELQETFYFRRQPQVRRVVFLGTPHHGSRLSPSLPARLALRFVRAPKMVLDAADELAKENPDLTLRQLPTSVDLLAPHAPALEVLAARPRPAGVHYHSVIGVAPKASANLDRWLAGDKEPGDGVVPYASAHLDSAETELVVPADHFHVHQHPLAVREVRRILLEHAQAASGGEVIQVSGSQ
jgi:pimeloyl-ACP methyl ester carboxylesterase